MYFYNYEPIWDLLQIFKWWWNADPRELNSVIRVFVEWFFFFGIIDASYSTSDTCGQQYVKKVTRINFFFLHIFQLRCINALLPDNHDI